MKKLDKLKKLEKRMQRISRMRNQNQSKTVKQLKYLRNLTNNFRHYLIHIKSTKIQETNKPAQILVTFFLLMDLVIFAHILRFLLILYRLKKLKHSTKLHSEKMMEIHKELNQNNCRICQLKQQQNHSLILILLLLVVEVQNHKIKLKILVLWSKGFKLQKIR